jgi:pimeloyl-ACP methyl ester carboxylesterase
MTSIHRRIDRRTCLRWGARAAAGACAIPALARASSWQAPAAAATPPVSRHVTVEGLRLHCLDWGPGARARPALVLLHAGMLNARMWEPFAASMSPFFHVVAPDARGHGESGWKRPYETDTLVGDLHGVLGALGLRDLTLCGNSMGGTLAIAYAARYPSAVRRLISVDTGAVPPPAPGSPAGGTRPPLPPPLPEGPFASPEDAAARIAPVMGEAYVRAMTTTNLKRLDDGRWAWKHDHAGISEGLARAMADPGRWARWMAVECPTLLLRGERSPALTPAMAEGMVAARPATTLEVVRDASHFIALDQPAAFERIVRAWLGV